MNTVAKKAGVFAVAGFAAAFGSSAMASDLTVGALFPLTGGLQAYGEASLKGVELAAEEANAAGGVLGGKVIVKTADSQTKSQASIDGAKKLVSVEGATVVVGPMASGNTIAAANAVLVPEGVPVISPSATAPSLTTLDDKDFVFRTAPSDAFQGVGLAQLVKEKGVDKVAVIYKNDDYGVGLAKAFEENYKKMGGTITGETAFEPNKASYRGELQKLASTGADHLLVIAFPDDGGILIMKQALEEGFFSKFIGTDGMKAEKIISDLGAQYVNGMFGTSPKALDTDTAKAFKSAYEKKYGELPPRPYIDGSYDATMVAMLAAEKAGSTDPKKIRDALRDVANAPGEMVGPGDFAKAVKLIKEGKDIDYVGASGPINFDENGDVSGTIEHWEIKDGKYETVKVWDPAK